VQGLDDFSVSFAACIFSSRRENRYSSFGEVGSSFEGTLCNPPTRTSVLGEILTSNMRMFFLMGRTNCAFDDSVVRTRGSEIEGVGR